jgi:hypothetical protein
MVWRLGHRGRGRREEEVVFTYQAKSIKEKNRRVAVVLPIRPEGGGWGGGGSHYLPGKEYQREKQEGRSCTSDSKGWLLHVCGVHTKSTVNKSIPTLQYVRRCVHFVR